MLKLSMSIILVVSLILFYQFELYAKADMFLRPEPTIIVQHFKNCPGDYKMTFHNFTFKRNISTLLVSGEEVFRMDVPPVAGISINIIRCGDKGVPDSCDYYGTWRWDDLCVPFNWFPLVKSYVSAHTPKLTCPMKKGNYTVKNARFAADLLNPFLENGGFRVLWKFHIESYTKDIPNGCCLDIHAHIANVRVKYYE